MNTVFLTGVFSPDMPSVGDHAQLYALEQFLADKFSDYKVVKLYRSDPEILSKLRMQVQPNDLIFISSSGDFGDKYSGLSDWHGTRKQIIETFRDNRVVQLPVSVYYLSACNFEVDKGFFADKPHFTLLCRTPESAEMLKANFDCDVRFFPDFTFYLKPTVKIQKRNGSLIILRNDAEACFAPQGKIYSLMDKASGYGLAGRAINKALRHFGYDNGKYVYQPDIVINKIKCSCPGAYFKDVMVTDFNLTDDSRKSHIAYLFELFSRYSVVVTDRFHAAVFSALTNTPCVALPTGIKDKIKGCSNLLPQTLFADSLKVLPKTIKQALTLSPSSLDYSEYFDNFRAIVFRPQTPVNKNILSSDTLTVIKRRRSIRKFNGLPIPKDKINAIVEAGIYAPSAANMQATRFKIVTDPSLIQKVCNQCSPWLIQSNPSLVIAVCYNLSQPNKVGVNMKSHSEPWRRFIWQDTACAMQNMMLAAESLRLASCWASISPSKFGSQEKNLSNLLALNADLKLTCLLLVGYPLQTVDYDSAVHQGYKIKRNLTGAFCKNNVK
jgi:exopolysaccharide biosynthesis predicted pyruvyltransferase EpsI/nitroreductase